MMRLNDEKKVYVPSKSNYTFGGTDSRERGNKDRADIFRNK